MTSTESPENKFKLGYHPSLDGVRGVAVIAVLLLHAYVPVTLPVVGNYLELVGIGGFLGVDIFFVLSGFLITALLFQEWEANGKIDFKKFYARRALRLLPALYLYLLVSIGYTVAFRPSSESAGALRDVAVITFYLSNWIPINIYTLRHVWSLAVEEQFYLFWPFMLVGIMLLATRFKIERRWILYFLLGVVGLIAIHRGFMFAELGYTTRVYQGLDTRADSLLLGSCAALFLSWNLLPQKQWFLKFLKIASIAAAALLFYWIMTVRITDGFFYYGGFTLAAVCVDAIILALLISPPKIMRRFFEWSVLVWIGRLSYGIYLWHKLVYVILDKSLLPLAVRSETLRTMVLPLTIKIGVSLVVASISFYFFEKPFLRLKKRFVAAPTVKTAFQNSEKTAQDNQPILQPAALPDF